MARLSPIGPQYSLLSQWFLLLSTILIIQTVIVSSAPLASIIASPILIRTHSTSIYTAEVYYSGYIQMETQEQFFFTEIDFDLVANDPEFDALSIRHCILAMEEFNSLPHPNGIRLRVLDEQVFEPKEPSKPSAFKLSPLPSFRPQLRSSPIYHFGMNCVFAIKPSAVDLPPFRKNNSYFRFEWALFASPSTKNIITTTVDLELITPPVPPLTLVNATAWKTTGPHPTISEEVITGAVSSLLIPSDHSVSKYTTLVIIRPLSLWSPNQIEWGLNPDYNCNINGYRLDPTSFKYEHVGPAPFLDQVIQSITIRIPANTQFVFKPGVPIVFECNTFLWSTHGIPTQAQIGALPLIYSISFTTEVGELTTFDSRIVQVPVVGGSPTIPINGLPSYLLPKLWTPPAGIILPETLDGFSFSNIATSIHLDFGEGFLSQFAPNFRLSFLAENCSDHSFPNTHMTAPTTLYISSRSTPNRLTLFTPASQGQIEVYSDAAENTARVNIGLTALFPSNTAQIVGLFGILCTRPRNPDRPKPLTISISTSVPRYSQASGNSPTTITRHYVSNVREYTALALNSSAIGDVSDPLNPQFKIHLKQLLIPYPTRPPDFHTIELFLEFQLKSKFSGSLHKCYIKNPNRTNDKTNSIESSYAAEIPSSSNLQPRVRQGKGHDGQQFITPILSYAVTGANDRDFPEPDTSSQVTSDVTEVWQLLLTFDWLEVQRAIPDPAILKTDGLIISCPGVLVNFVSDDLQIEHTDRLLILGRSFSNGYRSPELRQSLMNISYQKLPPRMYDQQKFIIVVSFLLIFAICLMVLTGFVCCRCFACTKKPTGSMASRYHYPVHQWDGYDNNTKPSQQPFPSQFPANTTHSGCNDEEQLYSSDQVQAALNL